MDTKKQKKILIWVVAVLVILNLGVISLFVIHTYVQPDQDSSAYTLPNRDRTFRHDGPGRMLTDRIDFNNAQKEKLRESFGDHREAMRNYKDTIRILRSQLMQELASKNPDTEQLDNISDNIGRYYTRLNKETIRHFMEMKTIANPQQQQELNEFFLDIANRQRPYPDDGFRHHPRRGR